MSGVSEPSRGGAGSGRRRSCAARLPFWKPKGRGRTPRCWFGWPRIRRRTSHTDSARRPGVEIDVLAWDDQDRRVRFGSCKRNAREHTEASVSRFRAAIEAFLRAEGSRFAGWKQLWWKSSAWCIALRRIGDSCRQPRAGTVRYATTAERPSTAAIRTSSSRPSASVITPYYGTSNDVP